MPSIRFEPPPLGQTKQAAMLRECVARTALPWPGAEVVVCQLWEDDPVHMWIRVRGKRPLSVIVPPAVLKEARHAHSLESSFQRLVSQCKTAWSMYDFPKTAPKAEAPSARKPVRESVAAVRLSSPA